VKDLQFKAPFKLQMKKKETIYALVGWFDVFFDDIALKNSNYLSTSPFAKTTHWTQSVFYIPDPV